jgi:hypothetical protein
MILYTKIHIMYIQIMDGVFVIVIGALKFSLSLKVISARRLNLNDSYCP